MSVTTQIWIGVMVSALAGLVQGEVKTVPELVDVDPKQTTLVAVELDHVTVEEAFDAACEFAKVPCRVDARKPKSEKLISIKFDGIPLAEALVRIAREGDLALRRFNGYLWYDTFDLPKSSTPSNQGENWVYAPTSNDGPFCGLLDRVEYRRSLTLNDPKRISRSMQVVVDTVPEPQVMTYSCRPFAEVSKAVDERGRTLRDTVTSDADVQHPAYSIDTAVGILKVPEPPGEEISELVVLPRYGCVRKFRRVEIDGAELAQGTQFECDGVQVRLLKMIDRAGFGKEYTLVLRPGKQGPATRLLADGTMCAMIDDAGRVMRPLWRSPEESDGEAKVLYRFCPLFPQDGNALPARLVVLLPLEGATMTPSYKFEHIPLSPVVSKEK